MKFFEKASLKLSGRLVEFITHLVLLGAEKQKLGSVGPGDTIVDQMENGASPLLFSQSDQSFSQFSPTN